MAKSLLLLANGKCLIANTSAPVVVDPPPDPEPGVALPEQYTVPAYSLPTGGTTYTPQNGTQFQTALTACVGGDVIVLDKDTEYQTNPGEAFKLPAKVDNGKWIYIISSDVVNLPEGTRVTASDSVHMPRIATYLGYAAALRIMKNTQKVRLVGLQITSNHTTSEYIQYGLFTIGEQEEPGVTIADDVAADIIVDRCLVQGNPLGLCRDGMVIYNIAGGAIINSHIDSLSGIGMESHALHVAGAPGPLLVDNNFMEAAGINMFVGDSYASINTDGNPVLCYDITVTNNHFHKRQEWDWEDPLYNQTYVKSKNLWETKGVQRCLIEGNVLENSYFNGGQHGMGIVVKTNNGPCLDVTIRNNLLINVYGMFGVFKQTYAGTESSAVLKPDAENVWNLYWPGDSDAERTLEMNRITITNNLAIGSRGGPSTGVFEINGGASNLTVTRNTYVSNRSVDGTWLQTWPGAAQVVSGTISDNIACFNYYGVNASNMVDGRAVYDLCFAGIPIKNNVIVQNGPNGPASRYTESGTWGPFYFPVGYDNVGFVNYLGTDPLDFALRSDSVYKGVGTDGVDPGCDVSALDSVLTIEF